MIKKYSIFKESLLNKLTGPTYDEILKNTSANNLLRICFNNFDDYGVEYALKNGASVVLYNKLKDVKEWFLNIINNLEFKKYITNENVIIWYMGNIALFNQEIEKKNILVDYNKIWLKFINEYGYSEKETETFISNILNKYLNLVDYTVVTIPW